MLWVSQENRVMWDLASLETDLAGCPRLQEVNSRHAEIQLAALWSKHPQTLFFLNYYFWFCKQQEAQIAASITTSCQRFDRSNEPNADKNVEYKHDRVRQSRTEIHNRHHVPFVWNKPPLIVQHNKESYKLFRCSLMAAHLQPLTCVWLDTFFWRIPRWSACFRMAEIHVNSE